MFDLQWIDWAVLFVFAADVVLAACILERARRAEKAGVPVKPPAEGVTR
jgi:hypothetical protein